jgi:tetratricopeptide (TPR) repeat protein
MKTTSLSRFTPSLMRQEALEAIFVQREPLAQRLVELTRDSTLTAAKHHTLLIGPRGIGKTHLISLVYHRIRAADDLRGRLLIAWLREEEWGVASFLDLLLRIFRALLAEHPDPTLSERVELLYDLPPDAAERAAAQFLKQYVGDRTLLLLVENLDDLFAGLGDEGQQRLRSYLQENPFCTILATAQSLFNGVSLQTSPFYGFFRIQHLSEFDLEDAVLLLIKIAALDNDPQLASFLQTPRGRARIRAVHQLAGGSPRIYVILAQFLTRDALEALVEAFMRTLDDLTPYYQARMVWLSPQQRKIIDFLCDRSHAVTVKEIAQRCFLTHQTVSSQLKELREKGYVCSNPIGRESYYELREPLMRMCLGVKKQRGQPVRLFVDFLRYWYSPDELQQRLALLQPSAALERECLLHALQASRESEDPRVAARLRDYDISLAQGNFEGALHAAEDLVATRGNARDYIKLGYCFSNLGHWADAMGSYRTATIRDTDDPQAWRAWGWETSKIGRWDGALTAFENAVKLDPREALNWGNHGLALTELGRHDEALASFDEAVRLEPDNPLHLSNRAMGLLHLDRTEEALATLDRAMELGDRSPQVLFNRAEALLALNHWDEGSAVLDEALCCFAHSDEPEVGDTEAIVCNLLKRTPDLASWRVRITTLMDLYDRHHVLAALGQGLVQSIRPLMSPLVSDAAARMWLDLWRQAAGDRAEMRLPLRLLDVAVRYRQAHDPRVLLDLPVEERSLLQPLLGVEPGAGSS